jgi:hypothetical protein
MALFLTITSPSYRLFTAFAATSSADADVSTTSSIPTDTVCVVVLVAAILGHPTESGSSYVRENRGISGN